MRTLSVLAFLLILALLLVFPGEALAGGWAVATLDSLPEAPVAGEPLSVGFLVRQHGITPVVADNIRVWAQHVESGERLDVLALPEGEPGHYRAEITFPTSGTWSWGIETRFFPDSQPMPDLTVLGETPPPVPSQSAPFLLAGLGLVAGALLSVWLWRLEKRPLRWALALAWAAGLLVLGGQLATGRWSAFAREEESLPEQAALGRDLFTAKGCVVCHHNNRASVNTAELSTGVGPDLSAYRNDPAFLRDWLTAPQEVRPQAQMPDLNLSEDEVEALVAFINSEAP